MWKRRDNRHGTAYLTVSVLDVPEHCVHTPPCVCERERCTSARMNLHTCDCTYIWGKGWETVKEIQ